MTLSAHASANYLLSISPPGDPPHLALKEVVLSTYDTACLSVRLVSDANKYFFNSLVSLSSAIRDLSNGRFGWATIKLYYSAFYSCRAFLALDGLCVLYVPKPNSSSRTLYTSKSEAGASPRVENAAKNTHDLVCRLSHAMLRPAYIAGTVIGSEQSMQWLSSQRNRAQYSQPCFDDPERSEIFKYYDKNGCEKILAEYANDKQFLYAFDPDHAMLALPLRLLISLGSASSIDIAKNLPQDKIEVAKNCCRPNRRVLTVLQHLVASATSA